METKDEIKTAGGEKYCSFILSLREWIDKVSTGKSLTGLLNIVTSCKECPTVPGLNGFWTFLFGIRRENLPLAHVEQPQTKEREQHQPESVDVQQSEHQSQVELIEINKYLESEIKSKDMIERELMDEIARLKQRERMDTLSIISEDSGHFSDGSSLTSYQSSSVLSQGPLGATGGQGQPKGIVHRLRKRLPFQGSKKERKGSPIYITDEGPVYCLTDDHKMKPFQLLCRQQDMDSDRVNTDRSSIFDGQLVNTKLQSPIEQGRKFKEHYGTCSTVPIARPSSSTQVAPLPQYFETTTAIAIKKKLKWLTLLEVGVMEESHLDGGGRAYYRPRSSCVRVGVCDTHYPDICKQVWNQGKCLWCVREALSSTPGTSRTLQYGVVVDIIRGKLGLIDLDNMKVLERFEELFEENLYPVFSIYPEPAEATVQMKIVSGHDIRLTEYKQRLIYSCLM